MVRSVKERAKESIDSLSEKTQAIIQKGGYEDNIKGIMKKRKREKDRKKNYILKK
jgi:hypothetical protein